MNWPRMSLKRFTDRMQDRETIDLINLPRQSKMQLAKKANPWAGDQGGGRGKGARRWQRQPMPQ